MRKISLFIIIALILALGLAWGFYHFRNTTIIYSQSENSAFKVIPIRTPIILEIPDVKNFIEKLDKNAMFNDCKGIAGLESFQSDMKSFSPLIEHEQMGVIFKNRKLLITFNLEGKNNIGSMFAFSLKSRAERNEIFDFIKEHSENGGTFTKQKYNEVDIYTYKDNINTFYISENQGVFFMSRHRLFVEEAIRQVEGMSLFDENLFQQLYSTVGNNSNINVFVCHSEIDNLLRKAALPAFRGQVALFNRFAGRSELDVTIKEKEIISGGYSLEGEGNDQYIASFKSQTPSKFDMDKVISANASMFLGITLSDFKKFQDDYVEFLKKSPKEYYSRETSLKNMEPFFERKAFIPQFVEVAGTDYAMVYATVMPNDFTANRFFIAKANNVSQAKTLLTSAIERHARSKGISSEKIINQYQVGNQRFAIYSFPFLDLPQLLMGNSFSAVQSNYLCFWGDYLIFSDQLSSMKSYLQDLTSNKTLAKNQQFGRFNSQMSSRSTFYYYLNIARSTPLANYYLTSDIATALQKGEPLQNFFAFGWQLSADNGKYFNNMYLKYDPSQKEEPLATWQIDLDMGLASKPYIVVNHNDKKSNEVVLQDESNNLILIDKEGKSLWKIPVSGKILGDIHQIDIYRNGKLQYLFNTQDQIYLVDRNGKMVSGFPIKLKSQATSGLSVLDYDNNKNYRFVVACDKSILVYDRSGQPVKGWQFKGTSGTITSPVQHIRENGKDYIVCADDKQLYMLDRQGVIRMDMEDIYARSTNDFYLAQRGKPCIVSSDTDGAIHLQYLDGKSEILKLGKFGENHFFIAEDVNNDKNTDFIITYDKKIFVFDHSGKKLFERGFDSPVTEKPVVFRQSNGLKMIGLICGNSKIYLMNAAKGDLYRGFPLQGNNGLSIGYFTSGVSSFNLLAGKDTKLLSYKIE